MVPIFRRDQKHEGDKKYLQVWVSNGCNPKTNFISN